MHLGVGSGQHGEQIARCLAAYEQVLLRERSDWVVVVGDVNPTLACTLAAVKLLVPVAHLEAGLRSWDRTMPEEINRLATDVPCDLLWTPPAPTLTRTSCARASARTRSSWWATS